ncbi:MAG TPA: hypothetical protein VHX37_13395 [Acidobacteriaceae bacterium]|jgi:hypothetical protein|nr:hypothetical protein [Acidobacteriaceae bacterium]
MKTQFSACSMMPLMDAACPFGDGHSEHCCEKVVDHQGHHRCACGYAWTERRPGTVVMVENPLAPSRGSVIRRQVARCAVLALCLTGFGAWFAGRGELARQRQVSAALHRALLSFGLDCRYQPRDGSLECVCASPDCQVPRSSTSTQEDQ